MRNVLVVAYHYPPYDTTAAVEASQLVRSLPERGWSPVVLSGRSDHMTTLPVGDEEVHRTRAVDVNRPLARRRTGDAGLAAVSASRAGRVAGAVGQAWWQVTNIPDRHVGWFPFGVGEGRRILGSRRFDLIFSMGGPFTAHLVASRLAVTSGVPWFADFRDLWTDNHHYRRVQPFRSLEVRLEEATLRPAVAMSAATPRWADRLRERFGVPAWVIPNGFDPADRADVTPPTDRFVLTYTGTLYPGGHDPLPLLHAVARLRRQGVVRPGRFELRFVGRYSSAVVPPARSLGIEDVVTRSDVVAHGEAMRLQAGSHALVFLLWTTAAGQGWQSAKLYEYAATGRPVLAVGAPDSDAALLVKELGAGVVAADVDDAARVLARWIGEWERSGAVAHRSDAAALRTYEWRQISHRLADAFDAAV